MPEDKKPVIPTTTDPKVWDKIKPIARQMRREPTPAENRLWQALRKRQVAGAKFRRQHNIDRYIVDFYCAEANLIIEVDGSIHEYTVEEDATRQEYLESLGLRVLRITNDQVFSALEDVLDSVREVLRAQEPDETTDPGG